MATRPLSYRPLVCKAEILDLSASFDGRGGLVFVPRCSGVPESGEAPRTPNGLHGPTADPRQIPRRFRQPYADMGYPLVNGPGCWALTQQPRLP
jgi:hypothetical protein